MQLDKQNQLFRILKRMSDNEIKYLKKFGYKINKDDSNILGLLDIIVKYRKDDMSNEDEIIKRFQSKYKSANYVKSKSRLLKFVLDGLYNYDRGEDDLNELFELISIAESLAKRDLFRDSLYVLRKAEKIASELEETSIMVYLKNKILKTESYVRIYDIEQLELLFETNNDKLLAKLQKSIETQKAAILVLAYQKAVGTPSKDKQFELLNKLQAMPAFKVSQNMIDSAAALDMIIAKSGIGFMNGNHNFVLKESEKFIRSFSPPNRLFKRLTVKMIAFYDTFLQACLLTNSIQKFNDYFNCLERIETFSNKDQNLKSATILYLSCMRALAERKLDEFSSYSESFYKISDIESVPEYRKISICYYLIIGSFMSGNHKASNKIIQFLKSKNNWGIREDVRTAIDLIELINHFEQNKTDLLEYELRNYKQKMQQTANNLSPTKIIPEYLSFTLKNENTNEKKTKLSAIIFEYEKQKSNDARELAFSNVFDFSIWMRSKLENVPVKLVFERH
ncbi:MAG: hypothetical protein ACK4GL_11190 [Flavobacteriales bacterium]